MPITPRMTNSPRTWELVVNISGELEGDINDWPANIQDALCEALERLGQREQCMVTLVSSRCGYDEDDGWYVHCWASELVVGIDYESMSREAIDLLLSRTRGVQ